MAGKPMMSDEQLMLQFQQGVSGGFEELFRRYRQPVYGFFLRRCGEPSRAEELAQETFLAVLCAADRYEPRAQFRTYLYRIALNLLLADRRKSGREVSDGGKTAELFSTEPDDPQGVAGRHDPDSAIWVRRALAQLDPEQREVLLLREYEQLSYTEISEVLRVPVNTVRSRLFRARMALKDLLMPERRAL
jgi:RNA polymerase sigma-70 factor (ECF subfamily)